MMRVEPAIDRTLLDRIREVAARRELAVSALSIDELAAALGMSRMTLYRRIGSRRALHEALRSAGHDPGEEPGASERAITAASDLIREVGIASLTLEAVAARAQCALPTIYARFGGRSGLLMAVFERHSPILRVKDALVPVEPGDRDGLHRAVAHTYDVLLEVLSSEQAILRAMVAEALRDPESEVGRFITTRYLPSVMTSIMPWVASLMDRGVIRRLPLLLVAQQMVAPLVMHVATRPLVAESGAFPLPHTEEATMLLAEMFCRAVEAAPAPGKETA